MARLCTHGAIMLAAVFAGAAPASATSTCPGYAIANSTTGLVDSGSMLKAAACSGPAECCALCTAEPKCVAFTFRAGTKDACRMTSFPSPHHDPDGVFSGQSTTRPAPPPPPPPRPPVNPPAPKYPGYCKGKPGKCKNVVYFLADDMRADWSCYGLPAVTPNLDSLAKDALLFQHAFCQISVCSPSRQSFMTSRRPDTHKVWNFIDANPTNTSATPGHFRDHGYLALGLGQ